MATPISFLEHASNQADEAAAFYGKVLDWTFEKFPMPNGGTYTMAKSGGQNVGGFTAFTVGDTRPQWLAYLIVPDCRAATDKAKSLGAKLEKECMDVGGMGTMTVLTDPTGARVALWEEKKKPT